MTRQGVVIRQGARGKPSYVCWISKSHSRLKPTIQWRSKSKLKILNGSDEQVVTKVMKAADKSWSEDVNVGDFASEAGMSKSQLTRKLHSSMNTSLNDLLKEIRLRRLLGC